MKTLDSGILELAPFKGRFQLVSLSSLRRAQLLAHKDIASCMLRWPSRDGQFLGRQQRVQLLQLPNVSASQAPSSAPVQQPAPYFLRETGLPWMSTLVSGTLKQTVRLAAHPDESALRFTLLLQLPRSRII